MNLPIINEQVSTGEGKKKKRKRETSPRQAIKVSDSAGKNVTPLSSALGEGSAAQCQLVPAPSLPMGAAQPLSWGCHQGDACAGLGREKGAVLGMYQCPSPWISHPASSWYPSTGQ